MYRLLGSGAIICEDGGRIHPVMPLDSRYVEYVRWLSEGNLPELAEVLTPEGIEAAKVEAAESAIQSILNAAAVAHGYDNILTASSYAALPVGSPFQAESAQFSLWRARCWQTAYRILADVKAGTRTEPTAEDLISEMPALELPQ